MYKIYILYDNNNRIVHNKHIIHELGMHCEKNEVINISMYNTFSGIVIQMYNYEILAFKGIYRKSAVFCSKYFQP